GRRDLRGDRRGESREEAQRAAREPAPDRGAKARDPADSGKSQDHTDRPDLSGSRQTQNDRREADRLHRGNRPLEPSGRDIGGEDEPGSNGGRVAASNQNEEDDSNEEQQVTRSARNGRDPKHCEQETRRQSHMQTADDEKVIEASSPVPSHH